MIENNKVSDKSGAQPKEPTKDPHMLRSSKALDVQEVITFTDLRNSFESGRNRHLKEVYGLLPTLLLLFAFPDSVNIIDRIERDILDKKDGKSAILMRDAICAKYVQVAVAAAIMAQVAITALSLADVDKTHWTVQASFIMSLVTGCLSVFYCCTIQSSFGSLIREEDIKDWLCKPGEWQGIERESAGHSAGSEKATSREERRQKFITRLKLQQDRWNTPSINAAVMLVAPLRLLYVSVGMFLIGLGIYLILVVSRKLLISAGVNASLAILIIYVLTVVWGLLLFYIPEILKQIESVPSKRVKREGLSIHLLLLAYEAIDQLEVIIGSLEVADDPEEIKMPFESGETIFKVLKEIMNQLEQSKYKPSQEAMSEIQQKIDEIGSKKGIKFGRTPTGGFEMRPEPSKSEDPTFDMKTRRLVRSKFAGLRGHFKQSTVRNDAVIDHSEDDVVGLLLNLPDPESRSQPGKDPAGPEAQGTAQRSKNTLFDIVRQVQAIEKEREQEGERRRLPQRTDTSKEVASEDLYNTSREGSPSGGKWSTSHRSLSATT